MKPGLLLIAILFSGSLFAQTVKRTSSDAKEGVTNFFYVLKSDKSIKEGPYATYSYYGNKLICEGFYNNNLKDSLWRYYDYTPDSSGTQLRQYISKTGCYKKDKKTGIWVFNDRNNEPEFKYNFSDKKVLYYKSDTALKLNVINGADTIKTALDQPPIFLDGFNFLYKVIAMNIRYPKAARDKDIQGKVIIAFTVDSLGKTSNFRVKRGIGFGCDEESLRVVKMIEGDWLPGMLGGKPVNAEFEIPVGFSMHIE